LTDIIYTFYRPLTLISIFNIVHFWSNILERVTEFVNEVTGMNDDRGERIEGKEGRERKDGGDGLDFLGGDGGFGALSVIKYRDDVRLLVGPIIGAVTHDTAVVMVEIDFDVRNFSSFCPI
jgi:hypothetical protein